MSTPRFPPVTRLTPAPSAIDDDAVRFHPRPPGPEDRIVLLLHGLGSHEEDLLGLAPMLPPGPVYASLRGVLACGAGYAWMAPPPVDPSDPSLIDESSAAVEDWVARTPGTVVGAIGFSQGGMLALQLLRRDARALDWIVQLSGRPFGAPQPGDAALAERRPPALWGHGGLDPLFDAAAEDEVRAFMTAHTALEEVRRPSLGHGIDQEELAAIVGFVGRMLEGADGGAGGRSAEG